MAVDYRTESPAILREFLSFHEITENHSQKTIDEYFLDLRMFFRFMKIERQMVDADVPFDEIPIKDIDLDFVKSIRKTDIYDFLSYLGRDRESHPSRGEVGLAAASRSRKLASLRSFYDYLVVKREYFSENPVAGIPTPRQPKRLPRYLTEEECLRLLKAPEGRFSERDYCIIVLFLNCGMRVSELAGINLIDIQGDSLRLRGKGNKERIVYLNQACKDAISDYLLVRDVTKVPEKDEDALFISAKHCRMSVDGVQEMLTKQFIKAGLDPHLYSAHKLRHTSATLMLKNGVDVRTIQEVLGHANLSTTQIYTHVDSSELRVAAEANPMGHIKREDL